MPNTLQIRRGLQASIPIGSAGELLFTTDTKRLYISDGSATNLLQGASSLLTTGAIPFSDANGKLTMNASSFYWDNTNNRLGIGTNAPAHTIQLLNHIGISTLSAFGLNYLLFNAITSGQGISANFSPNGTPTSYAYNFQFSKSSTANNNGLLFIGGGASSGGNSANKHVISTSCDGSATGQPLVLRVAPSSVNFSSVNDHFTIFPTGNSVFQNASQSATDAGFRLDVNGTARVQGNAQFGTGFYWDDTNGRLGIGTATPAVRLDVKVSSASATNNALRLSNTQGNAGIGTGIVFYADTIPTQGLFNTGRIYSDFPSFAYTSARMIFQTPTGQDTWNDTMCLRNNNVLINTTTDAGFKLDVNGNTRIIGSGATSSTNALIIQNSGTTTLFYIDNSGQAFFNNRIAVNRIQPLSSANIVEIAGGIGSATGGSGIGLNQFTNVTNTSGTHNRIESTGAFLPVSGTGVFNAFQIAVTINQTGGSSGITRGLFINPTLTAAADFRAIETTAGNVLFGASGTGFYWDNTNSRLGIGTATPAYGLDVNSTARFTGSIVNTAYFTSVQRLQFNNGNPALNIGLIRGVSDGVIRLLTAAEDNFSRLQFGGGTTAFPALQRSGAALCVVDGTGTGLANLLVGTTTDAGFRLDVNGTARVSGTIQISANTAGGLRYDATNLFYNNTAFGWQIDSWDYTTISSPSGNAFGGLLIRDGATGTKNTTAKLQVDSTTKGFLPPRQTLAQRTAIASPAVGLIVYQTDLVEGLYVYKSTGWQFIA